MHSGLKASARVVVVAAWHAGSLWAPKIHLSPAWLNLIYVWENKFVDIGNFRDEKQKWFYRASDHHSASLKGRADWAFWKGVLDNADYSLSVVYDG